MFFVDARGGGPAVKAARVDVHVQQLLGALVPVGALAHRLAAPLEQRFHLHAGHGAAHTNIPVTLVQWLLVSATDSLSEGQGFEPHRGEAIFSVMIDTNYIVCLCLCVPHICSCEKQCKIEKI